METKRLLVSSFSNSSSDYADRYDDQTSRAGSSSHPLLRQNYEVFLSFSGVDTRCSFTDHLYHGLINKGIEVFRDSESLFVGQKINELLEAIMTSKILVPIISTHYASSEWCLKEFLQILKCNKQLAQLVLPIFYKVKPSDVRDQTGQFGKEFQQFKEKHGEDIKLIEDLEQAFKDIILLKGWESDKFANGHEGELVKAVVTRIFNELRKPILDVPEYLVGVEKHVKEIMKMIDAKQSNDAKIIAIHGMGGIGKTTLAKVLYNKLSDHFDSRSFVPNIREASSKYKGMENLQKQVISDILVNKLPREISNTDEGITIIKKSFKGKRLLLLLDDVDNEDQLKKLAVNNNWFGSESIVIITTRNKGVIEASVVNLNYELNELDENQSYKLFCKHAFKRDASYPSNMENISRGIVSTTGGLPLAIEIIGSLLYRKSEGFWSATSKKLRTTPNYKVLDRLMLSYDALEYEQQQIFLDIACLPIRKRYEYTNAFYMWDACGFYPEVGIEILVSLSLIKVRDETIVIHDQLRDLGREIVRREGHNNIGMCSRLWLHNEEAKEVMERKQGTANIQALVLDTHSYGPIHFTSQQFEGMDNLRYLHGVGHAYFTGDFKNLSSNIIWFRWSPVFGFDIMGINFNPRKLVILELFATNITEYWEGWNQVKNLKVLKLGYCPFITTTPDFSAVEGLEELVLFYCLSLRKIHPSIGKFRKTLKCLRVEGCRELHELPIKVGEMEELRKLAIEDTCIRGIPICERYMTKLQTLSAEECEMLEYIPDSVGSLVKLRELNLWGCKKLESLSNLPCGLTSLSFNGDSMEVLPDISDLTNLKRLHYKDVFERRNRALNLRKLNHLETLLIIHSFFPSEWIISGIELDEASADINLLLELPLGLKELTVRGCQTLRNFLNLSNMKNLSKLTLKDCSELNRLELEGVESLTHLRIERCKKLSKLSGLGTMVMDLRLDCLDALQILSIIPPLKKLENLKISECSNLMEIQGLEDVESLEKLKIKKCFSLERIANLSHLKVLATLELHGCEKLTNVQGIEKLTSLTRLCISGPLRDSLDLSTLKKLKKLEISRCNNLVEIQGLEDVEGLETLKIKMCHSLGRIANLSHLKMLRTLELHGCEKLSNVQGIENLTPLIELCISELLWDSLDLSALKELKKLEISGCNNLVEIKGLEDVEGLKTLKIKMCHSLGRIANLSHLKMLRTLELHGCEKLSNVQGIENLTTLIELCISELLWDSLDLSALKELKKLEISGCNNLVEIKGLEDVEGLKILKIKMCHSLGRIANLSHLKMLRTLELHGCEKLSNVQGIENLTTLIELCISELLWDSLDRSQLRNLQSLYIIQQPRPLQEEEESQSDLEDKEGSESNSDELEEGEESQSDSTHLSKCATR